jgi:methylmalonyl-CoA mutase
LHVPTDRATRAGLDPDRAPASSVGAGGLSLAAVEDATALLDGIALAETPLLIPAGAAALPVAALIAAALSRRGTAVADLQGAVGGDPLGTLAAQGALPIDLERAYDGLAALTAWSLRHAPRLSTVLVDLRPYHDGGASAVQDLAFALGSGVEYLRALLARGLTIEQAAPRVQFAFCVGGAFFMEVARLRAARVLWARVISAFGGDAAAGRLRLHARTSAWTKTRADAYTNMPRATTEALAAVIGGCDSLHVGPFDEALGLPDEFSRRIARNVQLILQEESHLVRLVDPAGGSWYVEALTDQVAQRAWTLFQEVERRGGFAAALAQGFVQAGVAAVRDARFAQIAERREVIVGVNRYASGDERWPTQRVVDAAALQAERAAALERFRAAGDAAARAAMLRGAAADPSPRAMEHAIAAAQAGATLGELSGTASAAQAAVQVEPIPVHRAAERCEALRA